jgi:hypothetical protein
VIKGEAFIFNFFTQKLGNPLGDLLGDLNFVTARGLSLFKILSHKIDNNHRRPSSSVVPAHFISPISHCPFVFIRTIFVHYVLEGPCTLHSKVDSGREPRKACSRIPASNKFLVVCAGSADDPFHFCPLAPSPPPPVCHALIASSGNASSAAGHTERYSLGAGFRYVVVICPHSKQCSCFVEWRLAIAHLLCAAASSACAAEQWPRC